MSFFLWCTIASGFKYNPLWIQGLKSFIIRICNLTLLVMQGLWIYVSVLHFSCAKSAQVVLEKDQRYIIKCAKMLKGKGVRINEDLSFQIFLHKRGGF